MKLLPFENIIYRTKLDSEEILKRIGDVIEPYRKFRIIGIFGISNYEPYQGNINGSSFSVSRIIGYKNSFQPRIKGTIEKDFNGIKVKVKMRLSPFILTFALLWFAFVILSFASILTICIKKGSFEPIIFIPLGMFFLVYGLTTGGFKYESMKSKEYFAQLFEAEIEN
ncbi:hypothetical protein [Ascidiimonas sp. W6]|uniref:hypothetical protein n=1 Tax=Ascidiimonas meishanensis TaxID=3128903 RepID=UPI0030EEC09A